LKRLQSRWFGSFLAPASRRGASRKTRWELQFPLPAREHALGLSGIGLSFFGGVAALTDVS